MGLHISKKFKGGNTLLVWKIEESPHFLYDLAELTPAELIRLQGIKSPEKQMQWLAVRALLNSFAGQKTEIFYHPGGQPFLKSPIQISISHSADYVAILLNDKRNTGIDIQKITANKIIRAKSYFINENEIKSFGDLQDIEMLHILWSIKEAGFKYCRNPALNMKEDITVLPFVKDKTGLVTIHLFANDKTAESVDLHYEVWNGYTLVWTL